MTLEDLYYAGLGEDYLPICRVSGCTDEAACEGGCSWIEDPAGIGDLCSSCLSQSLTEEQQRELRTFKRCPFCKGSTFLIGPSGGMAQNFRCAKDACKATFNALGPFGFELIAAPLAPGETRS